MPILKSDDMESLNITTLTKLDITLPQWSDGDIFVLGRSKGGDRNIDDICRSVNEDILNRMDRSESFYGYSLRVLDHPEVPLSSDSYTAEGYNIICPISNPITGLAEYIVASIPLPLLPAFIPEVVNEAEETLKSYYREAILFEAASDPALFKEAVQSVITEPQPTSDTLEPAPSGAPDFCFDDISTIYSEIYSERSNIRECLRRDIDWSDAESDGDVQAEHEANICYFPVEEPGTAPDTALDDAPCAAPDIAPGAAPRDYLRGLTARDRQRIFSEIPEKASDRALTGHPEAEKMLESTLANMTPEESVAILQYLIKRHKAIGRTAVRLLIDGTSRYKLHVSERGMKTTREYRNKAHYSMHLKGAKGEIIPITFKHTASYCIYMMHVIDRFVRKGYAKAIDLHQCKRQFCDTYAALFDEEPESILAKYETLFTRNIGKGSSPKERTGRYRDYIKDIHTTFEKALGFKESMPFKIGENRFLPLVPDNINLPKKLSLLKIS